MENNHKNMCFWGFFRVLHAHCCALCPFGSTCQRFGMVWDARNVVGLMNYIFLYNVVCSVYFIIFHFGDIGCLPLWPNLGRAAPLGKATTFVFGA